MGRFQAAVFFLAWLTIVLYIHLGMRWRAAKEKIAQVPAPLPYNVM